MFDQESVLQGWMELASARHSMGATRVSSALYNLKSHHASTMVEVDNGKLVQLSASNHTFLQNQLVCTAKTCVAPVLSHYTKCALLYIFYCVSKGFYVFLSS